MPAYSDIVAVFNTVKTKVIYKETFVLQSPLVTLTTGTGDCHDQALLVYTLCKKKKLDANRLFFIEHAGNENNVGGQTHTLCYVNLNNKVYWIETSWGGHDDIREFDNVFELRDEITRLHAGGKTSKSFPMLFFKNVTDTKVGHTLKKYVDRVLENK